MYYIGYVIDFRIADKDIYTISNHVSLVRLDPQIRAFRVLFCSRGGDRELQLQLQLMTTGQGLSAGRRCAACWPLSGADLQTGEPLKALTPDSRPLCPFLRP